MQSTTPYQAYLFFLLLFFTARSPATVILRLQKTAEEEGAHVKENEDDVKYSAGSLPGAGFQLERHINVAVKMLSLDPNLAKIHARLIARIPEKTFWHHYFSRVAALRTEVGLEPLCEDLLQVRVLGFDVYGMTSKAFCGQLRLFRETLRTPSAF